MYYTPACFYVASLDKTQDSMQLLHIYGSNVYFSPTIVINTSTEEQATVEKKNHNFVAMIIQKTRCHFTKL